LDLEKRHESFWLRLMCTWTLHTDLGNKSVRRNLEQLDAVLGPWLEHKSVPDEEQQKIKEILSLVGARSEFLDLVRRYGINRLVPHVFLPEWWSVFSKTLQM